MPPGNPNGDFQDVTHGYFEVMGLQLLRGRFLTKADDEERTARGGHQQGHGRNTGPARTRSASDSTSEREPAVADDRRCRRSGSAQHDPRGAADWKWTCRTRKWLARPAGIPRAMTIVIRTLSRTRCRSPPQLRAAVRSNWILPAGVGGADDGAGHDGGFVREAASPRRSSPALQRWRWRWPPSAAPNDPPDGHRAHDRRSAFGWPSAPAVLVDREAWCSGRAGRRPTGGGRPRSRRGGV